MNGDPGLAADRFDDAGAGELAEPPVNAVLGEEHEPLGDVARAGSSDEPTMVDLGPGEEIMQHCDSLRPVVA